MGVKNMALEEESPNEGMERRQERFCGLAAHVGGGKGRMGGMGGLSLWAHMIGSLISAQLGPSNATEQQTGCQQTVLLCRKRDGLFFLMVESTFSVSTCPPSR